MGSDVCPNCGSKRRSVRRWQPPCMNGWHDTLPVVERTQPAPFDPLGDATRLHPSITLSGDQLMDLVDARDGARHALRVLADAAQRLVEDIDMAWSLAGNAPTDDTGNPLGVAKAALLAAREVLR